MPEDTGKLHGFSAISSQPVPQSGIVGGIGQNLFHIQHKFRKSQIGKKITNKNAGACSAGEGKYQRSPPFPSYQPDYIRHKQKRTGRICQNRKAQRDSRKYAAAKLSRFLISIQPEDRQNPEQQLLVGEFRGDNPLRQGVEKHQGCHQGRSTAVFPFHRTIPQDGSSP